MKNLALFSIIFLFEIIFSWSYSQTTITVQPGPEAGKDANVWSFDYGINHGDRESITAYSWTHDGDLSRKRAFLEFDLSAIPETAIIQSAYLSLFFNPTDPYESFSVHTGENDLNIRRITTEWDEHTVVWGNQPSTTTLNQVRLPPSSNSTQDYLNIEVTDLVKDMVNGTEGNHGFMIKMEDETNYYKSVLFASSDHMSPDLHPKLVITYMEEETDCITLQPSAEDGKDATASMSSILNNYGDRHSLVSCTWTFGGNPGNARIFLAFDFTDIPENATVSSANLSLFYNPSDDYESFDYHTGDNEFYIQRIINPWYESIIAWNNQPNTTSTNQVTVPPSSSPTQDYLDIDVTELVKDMIGSAEGAHGFMIRMVDEINYYRSVLFASSDHSNANLHPKLVVCFKTDDEELLATASAGSDMNLCYNSSYTLSGTAANGTVDWLTSGDGTFTGETTPTPTYTFGSNDILDGSVTLTIIVTGNTNTATDEMRITVKPEATAKAGNDASTCHDVPYTLSGSAMNGSVGWETSGDGVFSEETTVTPTYTFGPTDLENAGAFLIMVVTGNCNTDTDGMYLSVESIPEDSHYEVRLYPNPSSQLVTITLNHDDKFSVEIINYLGQSLTKFSEASSGMVFDVSSYAAGTYMVRLVSTDFVFVKKVVVQ